MIIIQEIGFREVCLKSKALIVQMYPIDLSFFWDNSQFVNYYVHHCYVSKKDQSVQNKSEKVMANIFCHDSEDIIFGVLCESIAKCRDRVFRLIAKNQE